MEKIIIIIILFVVIGLAVIGGGVFPFLEDVGKGGEKVVESGIFESVFEKSSAIIEDVIFEQSSETSQEEMQIALRIKELNDKGTQITASEYKELQTLIETYERNWGR